MIQNINDSLRRKYMNRSELYENPTLLEEIDNLFTTSFNQETVLYANLSMEDFAINSEYLLDDSETLINSVLKNSSYGIDHGYLFGSLTPQPFNKERKENIQLKLTLPKDTETVRLGSLSNSYYILKRDQALNYTKKEIIREEDLTPSIKIHAELVPASLLQLEINNFNDSMNNLLLEEFNIDYSLVNLEPIGLNAGFVLSSGEEVAKKSLTSLKTRNLIETQNVKDWEVFFTNGLWVHTEIFEKETEGMTIEQKREHFDHYYNSDSSGSTLKLENGIGRTSVNFQMLSKRNELQENILLEHISSIMLHEYFHFLIHNNNNFKERPMFKEDTFESEVNELKMSEENILIGILNDGYASTDWEEFICEAFRAMLHPHKPIAQRFEQEMIGTQRFLTNLFDIYPPTVPKNLQELEVRGDYVKFTFDHSSDNISVQKYNIYKNDVFFESYDTDMDENGYHSPNPAEDGQEKIEVEIKDLNQVTEYEFRVSAVDEAQNESEKSEPLKIKTKDTEPPELSGNLRKRVLASSLVHLNLPEATDNVGVAKTKIRRIETSSLLNFSYLPGTERIFELEGNVRHFSDVSIQRGKRYTYSMTALDEAGNESKPSNVVIVETNEEDDRKRNKDKAKDTTSTNSTLDWSGSFSGISPSGFQIFGWVQGLTGWAFTGITTVGSSLSSVAVGLTPGLSHLFLVLPIDGNGNPVGEGLDISVDALPHSVIDLRITDIQHTQISLNWESLNNQALLPGTLYHDIYRNDEKIATIDGRTTSYTDSGLSHSTKYEYYVVARIGDTHSEKSKTVTGTTLKVYDDTMVRFESVLFPSEILTHSKQVNEPITVAEFHNKSTQFIHLMFDESRNAYQLFNKETGTVFGIDPSDSSTVMMQDNKTQDDQFWVLNQIENNTFELENYQYNSKVLTVNNNRTTQLSDKNESTKAQQFDLLIDEEPPTIPQDLTYHDLTDTSVRLKWAPSTDNVGVSGYLVYNQYRLIGQVDSKTTEYLVNDLLSYTDYHFSVVAIDHSGNQSESSDILEVKTRPKAPANLSASDLTQTSITLHWENLEKAEVITGYEIYQDETLIRTVDKDTLSLSVENLDTAMYYNFTVKAKTAINSSLASEKLTIKTQSLPLSEIVKGYSLTDNEIIITLDRASYEGHNRIVLLNQGEYVGETYNNRFFYARLVNSTEDTVDIRFETNTITNDLTLEIRSGQPGEQQYEVLDMLSILPLSPPKNLSYDEIDDSSVRLSWEPGDNHSSETGYEIYQNEKLIQTVQASETTFMVENLQSATDYKFTVKTRVGSQTSQPSNEVEITTLPKAPNLIEGVWEDVLWSFNEKTKTIILYGGSAGSALTAPWHSYREVENILVEDAVVLPSCSMGLFKHLNRLVAIENANNFDTSHVTDMTSMFIGTTRLEKIDVSNWDTRSVTNMSYMFFFKREP
ncbi:fibronectin type III domain-containing protein [Serratia marcescens]|nr:fibronectin type III domain-containing protein [Serratia marcescens]